MVDVFDTVLHHRDMLPDSEGGTLAGGTADADGIYAALDLLINDLSEQVVVDSTTLVKRGNNSGTGSGKNRLSHN